MSECHGISIASLPCSTPWPALSATGAWTTIRPISQPTIPAHTTVDLRLGGEYQHLFWSASVQNLFDVKYFDYAVASSATYGRYNAYPLPGRTFMVKRGRDLLIASVAARLGPHPAAPPRYSGRHIDGTSS